MQACKRCEIQTEFHHDRGGPIFAIVEELYLAARTIESSDKAAVVSVGVKLLSFTDSSNDDNLLSR